MADPDLLELKRRLRAEGFEIYRTQDDHISLAERVRDNLILDSGVAVALDRQARDTGLAVSLDDPAQSLSIRVTLKAQASHFPGAPAEFVAVRAGALAESFLGRGYDEETSRTSGLPDPGDPTRILDTSHEVVVRITVAGLPALVTELRAAFSSLRSSSDE